MAVLVAAAIVAVVFVVGTGDDGPSGGDGGASVASTSSATPASDAHAQATAMNSLLNASVKSRRELASAIVATRRCSGLDSAVAGMQRVAKQRQQQLTRARGLQVGALPNGRRLRDTLARAISYSLRADHAYLAWARGAGGCTGRPKHDANYRRGGSLSAQASSAKQQFVRLWAPVARQENLPVRTVTQI